MYRTSLCCQLKLAWSLCNTGRVVSTKPLLFASYSQFLCTTPHIHSSVLKDFVRSFTTENHYTKTLSMDQMKASAKPELKMFKIERPEFNDIFNPELETLIALFKKYGYELRIAGGAVRDLLSGKLPADIDFASTATPEEMKNLFQEEDIRMINTTGESHGTITCRINDKENFEVTTLRIDVKTDGRHAKVEYTKDWELDALRRDLTINSMFLGFDGTVYDYFSGKEDLDNKRVRFVGSAVDRIQEDYLRILRYFRFYGRIADAENSHDAETLKAIRENADGLQLISGERIWMELKKILAGRFAVPIMKVILEVGIAKHIGLPINCNVSEMERVYEQSKDLDLRPMTIIASLLETDEEATESIHPYNTPKRRRETSRRGMQMEKDCDARLKALNDRLHLSRDEFDLAHFLLAHRNDDKTTAADVFSFCQDLHYAKGGGVKTKSYVCELLKYWNEKEALEKFSDMQEAKFPVSGNLLIERGVPKGPTVGKALEAVREKWKETRYTATREQMLEVLDDIIKDFVKK